MCFDVFSLQPSPSLSPPPSLRISLSLSLSRLPPPLFILSLSSPQSPRSGEGCGEVGGRGHQGSGPVSDGSSASKTGTSRPQVRVRMMSTATRTHTPSHAHACMLAHIDTHTLTDPLGLCTLPGKMAKGVSPCHRSVALQTTHFPPHSILQVSTFKIRFAINSKGELVLYFFSPVSALNVL